MSATELSLTQERVQDAVVKLMSLCVNWSKVEALIDDPRPSDVRELHSSDTRILAKIVDLVERHDQELLVRSGAASLKRADVPRVVLLETLSTMLGRIREESKALEATSVPEATRKKRDRELALSAPRAIRQAFAGSGLGIPTESEISDVISAEVGDRIENFSHGQYWLSAMKGPKAAAALLVSSFAGISIRSLEDKSKVLNEARQRIRDRMVTEPELIQYLLVCMRAPKRVVRDVSKAVVYWMHSGRNPNLSSVREYSDSAVLVVSQVMLNRQSYPRYMFRDPHYKINPRRVFSFDKYRPVMDEDHRF